jgi:hypothetical protein
VSLVKSRKQAVTPYAGALLKNESIPAPTLWLPRTAAKLATIDLIPAKKPGFITPAFVFGGRGKFRDTKHICNFGWKSLMIRR